MASFDPYRTAQDYVSAQERLWRAVLDQAMQDAVMPTKSKQWRLLKEHALRQERARDWFKLNNRDFQLICSLAGYDPERVLKGFKAFVEKQDAAMKAQAIEAAVAHERCTPGVDSDFAEEPRDRRGSATETRPEIEFSYSESEPSQ